MRLIVGLGNPGQNYERNRHNVGFMVLDKIAQKRGLIFRLEPHYESRFAEMATPATPERSDGGRGVLDHRIKLVEPQTFMNQSGKALKKCKDYWKVDSEDIWVIHDDVDLEFGKVRINLGGSSAGHNGIESIIDSIGGQFWRIRVGVGRSEQIPTEDWVLMNFTKAENEKLNKIIDSCADFVLESLSQSIKEQTFNIN